jgi:group I intron endonuclease
MTIISGIYCIENIVNNKKYIGMACNINRRKNTHFYLLNKGIHHNPYLQSAYNKYGRENFVFYVIQKIYDKKRLGNMELYWISYYNSFCDDGEGYNLTRGGDGSFYPSLETRKRISDASRGENNGNFGNHLSDDAKKRISDANSGENSPLFGKQKSEETKKRMSENHTDNSGENHPNFGKHLSEKTRKKISVALMGENHPMFGKHLSDEQKKKLSDSKKGTVFTEERKKNISMSLVGRTRSEQHKKNISLAKLTPKEVIIKIKQYLLDGISVKDISIKLGIGKGVVYKTKNGYYDNKYDLGGIDD